MFDRLPDQPGKLTIKEVTLTDEQVAQTNAISKTAYDITSDMQNGTFDYTLTLPTPKTENVAVKASEDGQNFFSVSGVTTQSETVTVSGLNHFTVFLISADTSTAPAGTGDTVIGPTFTETAAGQIGTGTITLTIPSNFIFNTASNITASVSEATTGSCANTTGSNTPILLGTGAGSSTQTSTPSTTLVTFNVKTKSKGNTCKITFSGMQIRATSGTPLASNITMAIGGTANITATVENAILTETAGAVSASNSTVSASPSSVGANGSTTSTITVTLKDSFNNLVTNTSVSLTVSSGTATVVSSPLTTNSSGQAAFSVKSSAVGSATFRATSTITITQTATVNFTDVTAPTTPGTPTTTTPTNNTKPAWNWTAATDNVAVDHYVIYWDTTPGGTANSATAATNSYTHTVALADGTWYTKVVAYDGAGNTSTASGNGSVLIDTAAPTGSITSPANNSYYNNTPTFTASASDDNNVASVKFQYKAAADLAYTDLNTDTSSPYQADWTGVTLVTNTTYNLQITITDTAGNTATASGVSFMYDNVAPGILYNYPTAGGQTSWYLTDPGSVLNIDFLSNGGAPLNYAQRKIDTGSWTNVFTTNSASYTSDWSINWSSLSNGLNQISLKVVDLAGNTTIDDYVANVSGFLFRKNSVLPTAVYVDPGYSEGSAGGHTFGYDAYTNLIDAVNAAASGATITINAGTYDGAVTISKNLTLIGSGNTTIIKKTGATAITVNTGTVTISQVKLSGSSTALNVTGGSVTILSSELSGNSTKAVNTAVSVTASNNYWGASSGPNHSTNLSGGGDTISDNVSYRPFYTDSSRTTLSTTSLNSSSFNPAGLFTTGTFRLPGGTTDQTNTPSVAINEQITLNITAGAGTSGVTLPTGLLITKTDGSNLDASQLQTSNTATSSLSGLGSGNVIEGALQWGIPNIGLSFSIPITLSIFVGTDQNGNTLNIVRSASTSSGWTSDGIVSPATCLVANGLCTFQATKASYYATTLSVGSSTSTTTSSSGGGFSAAGAPLCNDTKPGSAPTLLSATAGQNSVTLNWSAAADPVTYYLVNYSLTPGVFQYGNPNVGGSGTRSYTVEGLSGGITYYFKVRAGNGCAPGSYSNELSATPGGAVISGPAAGFIPGVLGASTTREQLTSGAELSEGEVLATESAKLSPTPGSGTAQPLISYPNQPSKNPIQELFTKIFDFFGKIFSIFKR